MGHNSAQQVDFFISYNHNDEAWATWIAHVLESEQYTTIVQAWDFRPGANFVSEMDQASARARRTIAVLSSHYLASSFTEPEWAVAFANDPKGAGRKLVPVRVGDCDVEGLLGQIVHINLVGKSGEEAREALIAGVAVGRAKPLTAPPFPGGPAPAMPVTPPIATAPSLTWKPVEFDLQVVRNRPVAQAQLMYSSTAVVDLFMVPVPPQRLEMRTLNALPQALASEGRRKGLFTQSQAVDAETVVDAAVARVQSDQMRSAAGLMVTRSGQRSAWISLPRDTLGSILDPKDLTPRIVTLLETVLSLTLELASSYALAIAVGPTTMLTVGDLNQLRGRTSSSLGLGGSDEVLSPPDDMVSSHELVTHTESVAEELVARLLAGVRAIK